MHRKTPTPRTLPKRCDILRIAAKARGELLHPKEGGALVPEPEIGGGLIVYFGFGEEVLAGEEAEVV